MEPNFHNNDIILAKNWDTSKSLKRKQVVIAKLSDEYINSFALIEYDKVLIDIIKIEEKIEDNDLLFSVLMDQSQLSDLIISKSQFTLHVLSEKKQTSIFGCN